MVQKIVDVFVTDLHAHEVTDLVSSSAEEGKAVSIFLRGEDTPLVVSFAGEEKDIAVGMTDGGQIITVSLGQPSIREHRHGTVVVTEP